MDIPTMLPHLHEANVLLEIEGSITLTTIGCLRTTNLPDITLHGQVVTARFHFTKITNIFSGADDAKCREYRTEFRVVVRL